MALGSIEKIIVCQSTSTYQPAGVCPSGTYPATMDAFVLIPSAGTDLQNLINGNNTPDYALLGQFFSFGFLAVLGFWALGRKIGAIFRVLR